MFELTTVKKVNVKLGNGYTTFDDSSSNFYINGNEEKEAPLNANIKKALESGILIRLNKST